MVARWRRLLIPGALLLLLAGVDACWFEPRVLLLRDAERIPLAAPRLRVVHLSDLHIEKDRPLLRRLLREMADARPDLVVVSGDFIQDDPRPAIRAPRTAATAAFLSQARRVAPVFGVQGHSEHQGDVIAAFERAGVEWLSNEGKRIGPDGGILLLGLNQQVGDDRLAWQYPSPFRPMTWQGRRLYGARFQKPSKNFYSHYDQDGALAWSGYEVLCDVRTGDEDSGASIVLHSRYTVGEDRMIRLRRIKPDKGLPGTWYLVPHGTALSGDLDTGVEPEPGRWYRVRLRTDVETGVVRVRARVWPADGPEPSVWQADAEDRSPTRVTHGTVGLWTSAEGPVLYKDLQVVDRTGRILLQDSLELPPGTRRPRGFREGARGTRLEMAFARSPAVPPGTPTVVLSHMADVVLEASQRGLDAVLAGHTHGGQVRLPFYGALTTRSSLGAYYGLGRFEFAAPSARGLTSLYINPGVGMSVLPIRFWCPPRWALIELGS